MDSEIIKFLHQKGFKNKAISIISGRNQSYVSKVCNEKLRANFGASPSFTPVQRMRFNALNQILKLKWVVTDINDIGTHIQLLKYAGLTASEIYENYYGFLSYGKFSALFKSKKFDKKSFSYNLYTELSQEEFLSLF